MRTVVGTDITLHVAQDSLEVLDEGKIRELLNRYCAFIRYPIELGGSVVNEPEPLWTKSPTQLQDKDYLDFFHKVFPGSPDPLFWIHLNVDHPFNLKGVLYFPKLRHELEASQGQVKLFCNQVFVADNCKELIPEFLTLLKGVVDCADLPLNVSRSYLQTDPTVRKINEHIIKKVADRLTGMAKTELETFKKYWDDIHPLVKFGMLRDNKFYDRMIDHVLFKTTRGEYLTLGQYLDRNKEKTDNTIIYASDSHSQAGIIGMLADQEVDVVLAETLIDGHFLPFVEMQSSRKFNFSRVDSDITKHIKDTNASEIVDPLDNKKPSEKLDELFRKHLSRQNVKVKVEAFKSPSLPGMLVIDESIRRIKEMSRLSPFAEEGSPWADEHTLIVNQSNPGIKALLSLARGLNKEDDIKLAVDHVYDLAYLQQGKLTAEMMQKFVNRSTKLLERMGH